MLLAGEAEVREENHSPTVRTRDLKRWLTFQNYTHSEPRFCALLLTEGASEVTISQLTLKPNPKSSDKELVLKVRDIVINDLVNKPSSLPTGGVAIRSTSSASRPHFLAALLLLVGLTLLLCSACTLITGNGSLGGTSLPPSGSLSVSFIDVGQGDGVLVQAGGEDYLIDAGRAEEGPNVVDFLRSRGVEDLDGIVVSNPDADHIGGFVDVFDAFEVGVVYVSGDPKGTLTYNTFLRGVRYEGSEMEVVRAGRRMDWGGVQADT